MADVELPSHDGVTLCMSCGWQGHGPVNLDVHFEMTEMGWRCRLRPVEIVGELVEDRHGNLVARRCRR